MKVVLVVHQFYPKYFFGTETYTLDLAVELTRLGHEVSIIAGNPDEASNPFQQDRVEFRGIPVYYIDCGAGVHWRFKNTYFRAEFLPIFQKLLRTIDPDVVHFCHLVNLGHGLIAVAKSLEKPTILSITDFFGVCWAGNMMRCDSKACNGPAPGLWNCLADFYLRDDASSRANWIGSLLAKRTLSTGSPLLGKLLKSLISLGGTYWSETADAILNKVNDSLPVYECADHIVMATKFMGEVYAANGLKMRKASFLTYGVELPSEAQAVKLDARYETTSVVNRKIRVGFVGQMLPHKGPDLLIEAFKRANSPNLELHLFGKIDEQHPFCQSILVAAKDCEGVQLRGTFDSARIYEVFSELDVLVIPSRWHENAPLVLLNGLASKTCVIVSDGKGLTEFVTQGRNGFVFRSGDVSDLAGILAKIAATPTILCRVHTSNPGYTMSKSKYASHINEIYENESKRGVRSSDVAYAKAQVQRQMQEIDKWRFETKDTNAQDSRNSWAVWEFANLNRSGKSRFENALPLPPGDIRQVTTGLADDDLGYVKFGITMADVFCSAVSKNLLHSGSILDIGFGCGRLMRLLHGNPGRVACAYGHEPMRHWIQKQLPEVLTCDWSKGVLDFPGNEFETVLCPLELIYSPIERVEPTFREVGHVLSDGGEAYFMYFGEMSLQRFLLDPERRGITHFSFWDLIKVIAAFSFGRSTRASRRVFWKKSRPDVGGINFLNTKTLHRLAEAAGLSVLREVTPRIDDPYQVLVLKKGADRDAAPPDHD